MSKRFVSMSSIIAILALAFCAFQFTGCKSKAPEKEVYAINLYENNPYLAEVWWGDDYDPEVARTALNAKYNQPAAQPDTTQTEPAVGGCSSWHKGNFHGRNIDWMMRDYATLIVHLPKSEKVKYASVGLIAGNPMVTKEFIDTATVIPEALRSILPATIVDGINECGVAINHNIVPYDGKPYEANGDMASLMVCRYVLDNCATAKEAVDLLSSAKITQAVVKLAHDYSHFFISDPTSSYVVEWMDGQFVSTEFKADGNGDYISANNEKAIMTNYFVAGAEKYGFKTNDFFKNCLTGAGIERAETIDTLLNTASTVEDHLNICKAVWYRQFCQGKTDWATENSGLYGINEDGKAYWEYPAGNMHVMDNDDIYAAAVDMLASPEMKTGYFDDFNANGDKITPDNNYWFTQHSVVYDLSACKGYIIMQEGLINGDTVEVSVE